uniref:Uncharacterized protein n=1 Tax=Percolomonas cosmopolitus TaxID=63605 RepID=A0A6U0L0M8_9EUKA|mmetsp:Transcript_5938/g.22541  ORF Transcript_5938/g.22541 Transcript_5938/m.22541 type:complete len:518 (+) Transcript_5938:820-2373(+)
MSKRHWSKHPLEGDGTITKLFHYLWKKNKDLESCPLVRTPDTIVYEHNFPNGWYSFSNNELRRKSGKDIETKSIIQEFERKAKREGDEHGIVAYYLSCAENDTGDQLNQVEFFNQEELEDFFFKRKTRDKGILQRFVTPKGPYNFIIQAIWSPHVMMLERRVNIHRITDAKNFSSYERAVTYEGPSHYSNEVFCAPHLQKEIKKVCNAIVKHFASTEHKKITRMVLYFKIGADNRLYLLWSSSIRIAPSAQHAQQAQDKNNPDTLGPKAMPLNLSPKFNLTTTLQQDPTADTLSLLPSTMTDTAMTLSDTFGHKRNMQGMQRSSSTNLSQRKQQEEAEKLQQTNGGEQEKKPLERTFTKRTLTLTAADRENLDIVSEALDNMMYEAYSHFLEGATSPFEFLWSAVPEPLQSELGPQLEDHLMNSLNCTKEENETGETSFFFPRPGASNNKLQHEIQEFKRSLLDQYKEILLSKRGSDSNEKDSEENAEFEDIQDDFEEDNTAVADGGAETPPASSAE